MPRRRGGIRRRLYAAGGLLAICDPMPEKEIVLTRSTRDGVEKLDFERRGDSWRVVLERRGAKERTRPKETVRQYATADDAWKDVGQQVREGFKIVLYSE